MRWIVVVLSPLLLSGCLFPAWVTYVSFAADGISLIATGKSTTDLALSAAAEQDCAMWRIFDERAVCRARHLAGVVPGHRDSGHRDLGHRDLGPRVVADVAGNPGAGAAQDLPALVALVLPGPESPVWLRSPAWWSGSASGSDHPYRRMWPVQFSMEPPTTI